MCEEKLVTFTKADKYCSPASLDIRIICWENKFGILKIFHVVN